MMERPYYMDYSSARLVIHKMVTSKYFDLAISAVIGLNVITMAMEFYMMPDVSSLNCRDKLRSPQIISHKGAWVCPQAVQLLLHWDLHNRGWNEGWRTGTWQIHVWQVKQMSGGWKVSNDWSHLFLRWNQLDVAIVFLSIIGIALEEIEGQVFPINPTIIRVMRVLRIARVLKLLKMAKGIRALLDTVMQALPQVTTFLKSLILLSSSGGKPWPSLLPPLLHIRRSWCRDVRPARWVPMMPRWEKRATLYLLF